MDHRVMSLGLLSSGGTVKGHEVAIEKQALLTSGRADTRRWLYGCIPGPGHQHITGGLSSWDSPSVCFHLPRTRTAGLAYDVTHIAASSWPVYQAPARTCPCLAGLLPWCGGSTTLAAGVTPGCVTLPPGLQPPVQPPRPAVLPACCAGTGPAEPPCSRHQASTQLGGSRDVGAPARHAKQHYKAAIA
ncbi:hypothetical protein HaLaN_11160 [Haematococcus lacustris]|uniref:Uncharacterized protein n=1 Tax=Haematococcus lacustris TaxID=44745 RepID=A0A699YZ86_HAELA|nr:hypothetical protein HaLaN_11160 [Haematococcus lacustris]